MIRVAVGGLGRISRAVRGELDAHGYRMVTMHYASTWLRSRGPDYRRADLREFRQTLDAPVTDVVRRDGHCGRRHPDLRWPTGWRRSGSQPPRWYFTICW